MNELMLKDGNFSTNLDKAKAKLTGFKSQAEIVGGSLKSFGTSGKQVAGVLNAIGVSGAGAAGQLASIASMGSTLANPFMLAGAAAVGATAAFYEYNKTLQEQVTLTEDFLKITGDKAVSVRSSIKSIADTYGSDYKTVLGMVDTLTTQWGVDANKACEMISTGMAGGANATGNMANMVSNLSGQYRDAGYSAEEFLSIMTQTKSGAFNDQGMDMIAKGSEKIREMKDKTVDALAEIGINGKKMSADINSGSLSMSDAIKQITTELEKIDPKTTTYGDVVKNVFGKVGVQAGQKLIDTINDMPASLQDVVNNMTDVEKATHNLQKADEDMQNALASLFGVSGTGFATMTTQLKTKLFEAVTKVVNGFIDLYNKSTLVRAGIASIALQFKQTWAVIKAIFRQMGASLEAIADMFEHLLEGDFKAIGNDFKKLWNETGTNIDKLTKDFANNITDAFKTIKNGEIKKITVQYDEKNKPNTNNETITVTPIESQTGKSGKSSKSDELKYAKDSLADYEARLEKLKSDYKKGFLPKLSKDEYKKQVQELENIIEEVKIKIGIDEESKKQLESEIKSELNKIKTENEKVEVEVEYKTTGINQKVDNTPEGKIHTMTTEVNTNDSTINKNNKELATLQQSINDRIKLLNNMNVQFGTDQTKWVNSAIEAYNKLADAMEKDVKKAGELREANDNLKSTNTQLVTSINEQQSILDKSSSTDKFLEGMQGINNIGGETASLINSIGSALNKLNSEDASGADKWAAGFQLINDVANTTMSMIQGIQGVILAFSEANAAASKKNAVSAQQETAANVGKAVSGGAAAMGEAAASGASLPFPANIAAIAAGVAAVTAVIASIFSIIGSFSNGGIVGYAGGGIIHGSSSINDHNLARVNSGEMILNKSQQSKLWKQINNPSNSTNPLVNGDVEFKIKGTQLVGVQNNYYKKQSRL